MRPFEVDIDPANVDPNGIGAALTGAGPWTIADAEFVSAGPADGLAHRLNLTSTAALNGITITIVGTDADDNALSEAHAGPNNNTVETLSYFKTVTSITAGATLGANTLDIGWVDEVMTKTYPINWRSPEAATYAVDVTGTANYSVQETFENMVNTPLPAVGSWYSLTALASKTADLASVGTLNATGVRLITTSYTDTAEIQMQVVQH